jgi:hypothetical protein
MSADPRPLPPDLEAVEDTHAETLDPLRLPRRGPGASDTAPMAAPPVSRPPAPLPVSAPELLVPLPDPETHGPGAPPEPVPFHPVRRPPMALLCAFDDGRNDGEWLRLRGDRFVVGRTLGDFLVPHDDLVSDRHAELSRRVKDGRYRWYLTDLGSETGTFVRVGSALLRHGQELLLGGTRFRFELPAAADPGGPRAGQRDSGRTSLPSLVEVSPHGREGWRLHLSQAVNWLGRDSARCQLVVAGDALLSPRQCRIRLADDGQWFLDNANSLNGSWLRVHRMGIDDVGQFQVGEQRFLLRVL